MSDFAAYLDEVRAKLASAGTISGEKDINYGHQFTVTSGSDKVVLTVYNGKKGRRLVWGGAENALQSKLIELVEGRTSSFLESEGTKAQFNGIWAGSDESGKGDFFGPLVVAAVVVDNTTASKLRAAGVKDCKLLSDKKILELEDVIKASVIDSSVLELKPKAYNLRYSQVTDSGENLNQLLSYGHIAALTQVLTRQQNCSGALIDQFTKSNVIINTLKSRFPAMTFRQQPKAESDLAVAAASVLARARFLRTMQELALLAGEDELPKGGGDGATACAQKIAARLGKAALGDFVKLHFANYRRM